MRCPRGISRRTRASRSSPSRRISASSETGTKRTSPDAVTSSTAKSVSPLRLSCERQVSIILWGCSAGSKQPLRTAAASAPSQSTNRTATSPAEKATSARTGITRRMRLRSSERTKSRSKLRETIIPGRIPSMRSGTTRRPSTRFTEVPEAPKQMPSPAVSVWSRSSTNPVRSTRTTRPIGSPTAFGVSNEASPALRPSKRNSDSPRVKLFDGSGTKSGTERPAEARRRWGRSASSRSRAARYQATTLRT